MQKAEQREFFAKLVGELLARTRDGAWVKPWKEELHILINALVKRAKEIGEGVKTKKGTDKKQAKAAQGEVKRQIEELEELRRSYQTQKIRNQQLREALKSLAGKMGGEQTVAPQEPPDKWAREVLQTLKELPPSPMRLQKELKAELDKAEKNLLGTLRDFHGGKLTEKSDEEILESIDLMWLKRRSISNSEKRGKRDAVEKCLQAQIQTEKCDLKYNFIKKVLGYPVGSAVWVKIWPACKEVLEEIENYAQKRQKGISAACAMEKSWLELIHLGTQLKKKVEKAKTPKKKRNKEKKKKKNKGGGGPEIRTAEELRDFLDDAAKQTCDVQKMPGVKEKDKRELGAIAREILLQEKLWKSNQESMQKILKENEEELAKDAIIQKEKAIEKAMKRTLPKSFFSSGEPQEKLPDDFEWPPLEKEERGIKRKGKKLFINGKTVFVGEGQMGVSYWVTNQYKKGKASR